MDKTQEEQTLFIGGSRGFTSYHLMCKAIRMLIEKGILTSFSIISGGAFGADSMAEAYAKANNLSFTLNGIYMVSRLGLSVIRRWL